MNAFEKLRSFRRRTRRIAANSRVVATHWDHETIDYLIVSPKSSQISQHDAGRLSWAGFANPLLALAAHLDKKPNRPQRWIALLSRPTLEQLSLTLPPAEVAELPNLVAAEVEQQLGDSDTPPVLDFVMQAGADRESEQSSQQVLAFALAAAEVERLQGWGEQSGLRLAAIASRELSPLGILRRKHVIDQSLNISVHLVSGEAELAVCRGADPIFLRLIRIPVDDPQRAAEQVWMETLRCLTILPDQVAELPQAWYVFTTCDAAWHLARSLEDRGVVVQPVDPLFGWQWVGDSGLPTTVQNVPVPPAQTEPQRDKPSAARTDEVEDDDDDDEHHAADAPAAPATGPLQDALPSARYSSAANAGAAWEFLHAALPINLLAPRQAPVPPNPLHRWAAIAAAALALLGLASYFMLSDVNRLRTEVADLQGDVTDAKKLAAKLQEKADQVAYVETWLSDQVDWLAELNEISNRLPQGEQATVRRLTATASGKQARIDLSVQVAAQENIAQLESQIRSAKYQATSQRISQNPDSKEYPWQFETHIDFAVEPPARDVYVAGAPPQAAEGPVDITRVAAPRPVASHTAQQETP